MANLPAGALRGKRSRNIRRNLAVLTNGRVGGLRFKVHDEEAAKQRALKSLKQVTRLIAREALKVGSDPVAQESDKAAWRQFQKALEFLLSLWSS